MRGDGQRGVQIGPLACLVVQGARRLDVVLPVSSSSVVPWMHSTLSCAIIRSRKRAWKGGRS